MDDLKLFDGEYKFACLVWDHEPLGSGELVKLSAEKLGWKKSTTYTVLKKLCQKGILRNENAVVTALVKREAVQKYESQAVIEKAFDDSLPKFIASFLSDRKLSQQEAAEILALIETHQETEL